MLISSPPCGPCSCIHKRAVRRQRRALARCGGRSSRFRAARPARPTKGLSPGTAPSLVDAHHLAEVVVQLLRVLLAAEALAQRQEQRAVAAPRRCGSRNAVAARDLGPLAEDHPHVFEPAESADSRARASAVLLPDRPPRARRSRNRACGCVQSRNPATTSSRPPCPPAAIGGTPGHRRAELAVGADHPHAPGPLGHEKAPLRQKATAQGFSSPERPISARTRLRLPSRSPQRKRNHRQPATAVLARKVRCVPSRLMDSHRCHSPEIANLLHSFAKELMPRTVDLYILDVRNAKNPIDKLTQDPEPA